MNILPPSKTVSPYTSRECRDTHTHAISLDVTLTTIYINDCITVQEADVLRHQLSDLLHVAKMLLLK